MNKNDIHNICKLYNIINYTINEDLSIDVDDDVTIVNCSISELPLKFGIVNGTFDCRGNILTTLKGAPRVVGRNFYCSDNKLTTLKYGPEKVGHNYQCGFNRLTSLQWSPKVILSYFSCYANQLTSLEDGPSEVYGAYNCSSNQIFTLDGCPTKLGGEIRLSFNSIEDGCEYWKLFDNNIEVEFIINNDSTGMVNRSVCYVHDLSIEYRKWKINNIII